MRTGPAHLGQAISDPAPPSPRAGQLATIEDVDACYRLLLGRDTDPVGYGMYTGFVTNQGITRDALVGYFLDSNEFRDRLKSRYSWSDDEPVRVDLKAGYPFYVGASEGSIGADIRSAGEYEPHLAPRLAASLSPGDCFVDVGASMGFFTVLAGRIVGPSGRVIACEPGPQNHSILLLNAVVNGLDNVELHKLAISDRPEVLSYSRSGDNGSIAPFDGDPGTLSVHDLVQARPLDHILDRCPRVDVVKIDVEGAEGKVLNGATQTLQRHRPTLFFELTPAALLPVSGINAADLLESLVGQGYGVEALRPDRPDEGGSGLSTPAAIMDALSDSEAVHFDIMASPLGARPSR